MFLIGRFQIFYSNRSHLADGAHASWASKARKENYKTYWRHYCQIINESMFVHTWLWAMDQTPINVPREYDVTPRHDKRHSNCPIPYSRRYPLYTTAWAWRNTTSISSLASKRGEELNKNVNLVLHDRHDCSERCKSILLWPHGRRGMTLNYQKAPFRVQDDFKLLPWHLVESWGL